MVGQLWYAEKQGTPEGRGSASTDLGEAALNTIGYVVSRYGALTGRDLENLTHAETPWRRADERRRPGESARIERDWLIEYFLSAGDDDIPLDAPTVRQWLRGAGTRRSTPAKPDDLAELRARITRSA